MTARLAAALIAASTVTLAAGAGGALAAGDIPASPNTTATLTVGSDFTDGTYEVPRDVDWYRVALKAGEDYAVAVGLYRDSQASVIAPDGAAVLARSVPDGDGAALTLGAEFRVPKDGTYFVEAYQRYPQLPGSSPYIVRVSPDCRGNATTRCRLKPGVTRNALTAFGSNIDWYRVSLERSRLYDIRLAWTDSGRSTFVNLVDAKGRVLVKSVNDGTTGRIIRGFRPPRDGVFYVQTQPNHGDIGAYALTLTRRYR